MTEYDICQHNTLTCPRCVDRLAALEAVAEAARDLVTGHPTALSKLRQAMAALDAMEKKT